MNKTFSANRYIAAGESGIAVVRIVVGMLVAYHGFEIFDTGKMKDYAAWEIFNRNRSPEVLVYLGKGAELLSGILLAIGLLTRLAAMILVFTMLYITFFIGNGKFWYEDQHPFLFVLLGLIFFCSGSGKYGIDNLMRKK